MESLRDGPFVYDCKYEEILDEYGNISKHLSHLFFTHKKSIELTRMYPTVLLLDCTYKTNKSKMPLLNVVAISPFNSTFTCCFAFLRSEQEEDYIWALERLCALFEGATMPSVLITDRDLALLRGITKIFPNSKSMLCSWHIEKNILTNCQNMFETADEFKTFMQKNWIPLINSSDEKEYNEKWSIFIETYQNQPDLINYLSTTWLQDHKEKFVKAWTNSFLHLGHTATSRVEGSHSAIKKYLQNSTSDLKSASDKIGLFLINQFSSFETKQAQERIRFPTCENQQFFTDVMGKISIHAFRLIEKEYLKMIRSSTEPLAPCTG